MSAIGRRASVLILSLNRILSNNNALKRVLRATSARSGLILLIHRIGDRTLRRKGATRGLFARGVTSFGSLLIVRGKRISKRVNVNEARLRLRTLNSALRRILGIQTSNTGTHGVLIITGPCNRLRLKLSETNGFREGGKGITLRDSTESNSLSLTTIRVSHS